VKQFLLLVAVIAVIFGALLVSLYILDLVKLAELQNDLRKVFGVLVCFWSRSHRNGSSSLARSGTRNSSLLTPNSRVGFSDTAP
jgi:hypothetical protein